MFAGRRACLPALLWLCLALVACGGNETVESAPLSAAPQSSAIPTATAVPSPTPAPTTDVTSGRIPPTDPNIRYIGRVDFSNPLRPAFDWPAVTIEAIFEGTAVDVLLEDGRNSYNVTLDGEQFVLQTRTGQTVYPLGAGLAEGRHTVRLTKRTEPLIGTAVFLGFQLDPGRGLAPLPPAPPRRIEFIGDSITTGYGNEGATATCDFSAATENGEMTYAAMTARQLNAEYAVIAYSGLGIVRNYNDVEKTSRGTMYTLFQQTLANERNALWDFGRWTPDAVVINLGTNDFSTTPHPEGEVFLDGYTNLIGFVRSRYPQAHIFAVAGPVMADPAAAMIQSAVAQVRQMLNDERVHYVALEDTLLRPDDYGCDWHPNVSGHKKMADQLVPAVAGIMGW